MFKSLSILALVVFASRLSAQEPAISASEELIRLKSILTSQTDSSRKGIAAFQILTLKTDSGEGIEFLRDLLRNAQDPDTTQAVLTAFSTAGNYSALEEMLLLVSDAREPVRVAAIDAFRKMPDQGRRLVAEILRVIASPVSREPFRRAAIVTAGELGLLEAVGDIAPYLDTASFSKTGREALRKITGRWFVDRAAFELWWESRKTWAREKILEESLNYAEKEEIALREQLLRDDLDRHLSYLSAASPGVRKLAASGIGNFRNDAAVSKAIEPLCRQFLVEYEPEVREAILATLGSVGAGNRKALSLLLEVLDSDLARERRVAVRALTPFTSQPEVFSVFAQIIRGWVEGRRHDELEFRLDLLHSLSRSDPAGKLSPEFARLLGRCLREDPIAEVRKHAALALNIYATPESVRDLSLSLDPNQESDFNVRFNSANALKQLAIRTENAPAVLPALHAFLQDPAYQNRKQAVDLLGEIHDESSSNVLLQQLQIETDLALRRGIFLALGKIGDRSGLDSLLKFELREKDDRESFFSALESLAGKETKQWMRIASEAWARKELRWTIHFAEKVLATEGLDTPTVLEAEKLLVPAYRLSAREVSLNPNLPAGSEREFYSKARTRLMHLKESEPEQLEWALAFAEVQNELGDKDAAVTSYRELLPRLDKLSLLDSELFRRAGEPYSQLLLERKDLVGASHVLGKIAVRFPGDRLLWEKLARTEKEAELIRESIADWRTLKSFIPPEEKENFWRVSAELAELLLQYCNGVSAASILNGIPAADEISPALRLRLEELQSRLREIETLIGPLPAPQIPIETVVDRSF